MKEQGVWPHGEGLSLAMDEAVLRIIGLANLFETAAAHEEIGDLYDYAIKGMLLNLKDAADELEKAYQSLCKQDAEESGEEAETG